MRATLIWAALGVALLAPITAAAFSPLLQWREGIYIASGFAGILGMALLLLQPLLAAGDLPGLSPTRSRRIHRITGALLVLAVVGHVAGLWITSPPDVIDVLLFRSPTPFAIWGVIAMWAVFAAALIAALRKRLPLRPTSWRRLHAALVVTVAGGTVAHALLIQGTMEPFTKYALSICVGLAALRIAFIGGMIPRLPFGNASQRTHR
ncbi:ferric reductase-like transmembrane domain-containing protein [Maritimibacter sp. DP1N21-5]|uniref:ferric reductase-like transmembrane domain-containing protein n=1 Tax=Maritimibacter sp. DP1N21-5 TaxID=2836867 RepID=UPI0021048BC7|nr:ferric reductase-like transmembrane domain-containing protein [Maritimibacter sp. DP1N21-5]